MQAYNWQLNLARVNVFLLQTDSPINSSSDSAFLVVWKQLVALNIILLLKPQGQAKVLSPGCMPFFSTVQGWELLCWELFTKGCKGEHQGATGSKKKLKDMYI